MLLYEKRHWYVERFALIGILDEAFDLYMKIEKLAGEIFFREKEKGKEVWLSEVQGYYEKPVMEFIVSHKDVFLLENKVVDSKWIERFFSGFKAIDEEFGKGFHVTFKAIDFAYFLWQIVRVAVNIACVQDKTRDWQTIDTEVNKKIRMLAEKQREKKRSVEFEWENPAIAEDKKKEVWVYGNTENLSCVKERHPVESRTLYTPLVGRVGYVKLPVRYCKKCDKYFVSEQTIAVFEMVYGKLILRKRREKNDHVNFSNFNIESELHSFGYNVRENGMTEKERHAFLASLLANHIMTEQEICRDIENAIRIAESNYKMQAAVIRWERDLFFVRGFCMKEPTGTGELKYKKY